MGGLNRRRKWLGTPNRKYCCPICGNTDPTSQEFIKPQRELVIFNCSTCHVKLLIAIVKEGESKIENW